MGQLNERQVGETKFLDTNGEVNENPVHDFRCLYIQPTNQHGTLI